MHLDPTSLTELLLFALGVVFQVGVVYGAVKMAMKDFSRQLHGHQKRLGNHGQRIGILELQNARHFPDDPIITLPPQQEEHA